MEPYTPDRLPLDSIDWERHVSFIGKANAALARYDGILLGIVNPQILLSPLIVREAVLSSRIEGTRASLEDVLQYEADIEELRKYDQEFKDILEIINYRKAMGAAVQELEKRPLTINMIRNLHFILLTDVRGKEKAPGEIRRIQNYIAPPGTPIDRAIFIPPTPPMVMDALSNWEWYLHSEEKDLIVQLAILKAQFELVHPFIDGNGRIGRMLVPLILYSKKVLSSPMLYISAYLERNRSIYYERMLAISRDGDWDGWISFFLNAVIEQAEENSRKAKAILVLYNDMKQQVPETTHSQYSIQAIDTMFSNPIFNSKYFTKESGIPRKSAERILRELKENEILDVLREGKGRRPALYMFPQLIHITERL
jgi:Fic family protein